jgi:peptide/nickel transport system ATP-binding protein
MLEVDNLKIYYFPRGKIIYAVDDVTLKISDKTIVGIVGESGSGKSTLAYGIIRLVPPPGKIVSGSIRLNNIDITKLDEMKLREVRGKKISMVFQDPLVSLDPLMKIGDQIVETILAHEETNREEAIDRAHRLLEDVGVGSERYIYYPHQLSGGQRQRVMIAIALSLYPDILLADEPTTALDVIIQEQIMNLFSDIRRKYGTSIMLISHDISLVIQWCDKIGVMYAGELVEYSDSRELIQEPLHPYTKLLLEAVPDIEDETKRITSIPGTPPDLSNPPPGCRFHPRCPYKMNICNKQTPPEHIHGNRRVKCWLYGDET